MENQTEFSSSQSGEQSQTQPQIIKPQKSGLKKLGLVLLIACPIILVLFLPGYAIVTFIFNSGTDFSIGTQRAVKVLFQFLGIFSVIGIPLGGILYAIGKKSESKKSSTTQM